MRSKDLASAFNPSKRNEIDNKYADGEKMSDETNAMLSLSYSNCNTRFTYR